MCIRDSYVAEATAVSPDHPVYLDKFLEGAVECDLDALCDGEDVYICLLYTSRCV